MQEEEQNRRRFAVPLSLIVHGTSLLQAGSIRRQPLGIELLSESGDVVAEVFRSDRDRMVTLSTFSYDVPLEAIESLLVRAKERLDPFADGVPLSEAVLVKPVEVVAGKLERHMNKWVSTALGCVGGLTLRCR